MLVIREAPSNIKKLVEKFNENIESYKSSSYNETTVRQEFIDPLFIALGWDVNNEQDTAPQYRDVILEDSIKVGGKTKAPDYSFTLHGRRMFFVEAKKPSVNIAKDKNPAHQLRRYAWSAKLALSVLTDFEELAIYESKTRPSNKDNVSTGRVALYKYTDYVEKWDEIYNILSKEAVLKGSFDKYAKSTVKKGTSEVDDEFLKEIENWRLLLARNIAIRNEDLTVEDLNYAVQQTIDRIIFLRMAEDRGVEPYQRLFKILEKPNIYEEFGKLCIKADEKYNSGLFHFKEEKNISQPADTFTLKLKIDDGVFKEIIKNLYYPLSPYEFSVLSPEILGNVYEQFLGKIIRLTPSHKAKIEEKPEVKKAGGVYYTPQYIVDYIVENTLGKICKDKTPKQISKIRILDPACGSGSFLLGAYNYLLKWHLDYYSKLTKHPKNTIYQGKGGEYFLTIQKKKEILLNNIYGVDIDTQAVEVTKLSLLLKVLENENKDALEQQKKLIQERVLPYLGDNIKCGNSLIGTDILENNDLTQEEIKKINPFDWKEEFFNIVSNGGFDAVIGNPPYITPSLGRGQKTLNQIQKDYLKKFDSYEYKGSTYAIFIEIGKKILKKNGLLGYITPNTILTNYYFKNIRNLLLNFTKISLLINIKGRVFDKAETGGNLILIFEKNDHINDNYYFKYLNVLDPKSIFSSKLKSFNQNKIKELPDSKIILDKDKLSLISKINKNSEHLEKYCNFYNGIKTGNNKKFLSSSKDTNKHIKVLRGRDIFRYFYKFNNNYVLFDKEKLWSNYNEEKYNVPEKIVIRQTADKIIGAYDNTQFFTLDSTHLILPKEGINIKYILALINSELIRFYYSIIVPEKGRTFAEVKIINIKKIPIIINPDQEKIIVKYVDKNIELTKKLYNTNNPHDKKLLETQIKTTDDNINNLIYKIYNLNNSEINIIKNSLE